MNPLSIPFSVVGQIAFIYLLYIFAALSRRLGAVTKMKPYYRGFYLAMALVGVATFAAVLRRPGEPAESYILVYHAPLVLAGLISLAVAYRYWGWLFLERTK